MLYYRSKDDLFDDSILDSVTHRGWIEILPMSKSEFDLISLIDFMDCLSPDFICTYFNSRTYITIVAVSKYLQRNNESIKIYIKDGFSNITVFVQDGLYFIQNTSINNVKYIFNTPIYQEIIY